MDTLDLRILRALGIQAWSEGQRNLDDLRPATLARRFRVRPELVRERISRLESSGVVAGYEIYPNFRHLGLDVTTYHYTLEDPGLKAAAVDEAAEFEGVFGVFGYLGQVVCVDVCHRSPADRARRLSVLGKLMNGARGGVMWERNLPAVTRALDVLDWRIIKALRGDAHRPLEDVAADLGISIRTVRRRFAHLASEGSIDVVANFDPTCIEGNLMVEFHVFLAPDAPAGTRRGIQDICGDNWFAAWTPPDEAVAGMALVLVGPSVARFEELRAAVEALPGVRSMRVLVPSRVAYRANWIDEAIEEKLVGIAIGGRANAA